MACDGRLPGLEWNLDRGSRRRCLRPSDRGRQRHNVTDRDSWRFGVVGTAVARCPCGDQKQVSTLRAEFDTYPPISTNRGGVLTHSRGVNTSLGSLTHRVVDPYLDVALEQRSLVSAASRAAYANLVGRSVTRSRPCSFPACVRGLMWQGRLHVPCDTELPTRAGDGHKRDCH